MNIDTPNMEIQCFRCGKKSRVRRGNYYASRSNLFKGVGYLPVCNECVDEMFDTFMKSCADRKTATRMLCAKLNLYWNERIFDNVSKQCSQLMVCREYVIKVGTLTYANKSYEDTLLEEGNLTAHRDGSRHRSEQAAQNDECDGVVSDEGVDEVDESVREFWGRGYSASMYKELEERKNFYLKNYSFEVGVDVGKDILFRTACVLEVTIAHDSAAGRPINTSVNSLNQILDSLNLKPNQKKTDPSEDVSMLPFGVRILRWENSLPVPEPEKKSSIVKYALTWIVGYLAKTFASKNPEAQKYARMYDEALEKYSVKRPEFDESDNEIADMLSELDDG